LGSPKDSIQTKLKLIQVAGVMFAEYGYNQVTVRDIIEAAHANLGALNYHFGTKECLYGEVLKEACLRDRLDSIEFEGDGPRELLSSVIKECLRLSTVTIEENWHFMLIKRECQYPSHLFDRLAEEHFSHQLSFLAGLIGEIVGRPATDAEVELSVATMVGLMDMFGLNRDLIATVSPHLTPYLDDSDSLVERIVRLVISSAEQYV
jgi:AcrR family transcriptional regulator